MISINGKELKVFASILARGGSKGIVKKKYQAVIRETFNSIFYRSSIAK